MKKIIALSLALMLPSSAFACQVLDSEEAQRASLRNACQYYSFMGPVHIMPKDGKMYCAVDTPNVHNGHDDYVLVREVVFSTRRCGMAIGTESYTDPATDNLYRRIMMGRYYTPYPYPSIR